MKKRIEWIDIAKFIGIFFVMLSHFEACPDYLRAFFTPFYLSVFFFCSGYTYRHKDDFPSFLRKKIRQLVLPWFIYSNLNIILSNIKSFKHHENGFLTEVFHNLLQIRYFDERLWFIPALFSAFIPFFFLIRSYKKNRNMKVLLSVCIALAFIRKMYKTYMDPQLLPWKLTSLPWHIDYIPTAMLFMVLGYLFHERWEDTFERWADGRNGYLIIFIYLVMVYFAFFTGISFPVLIDFLYDHLRHFFALAFIVIVSKRIPSNRFMLYIGANTLIYFCIHNKAVTLIEALFKKFLPGPYSGICGDPLLSTVFCLTATSVVSAILLIPTEFINRCLPWTVGKTVSKNG